MALEQIEDPALIEQLDSGLGEAVVDPSIIAALEQQTEKPFIPPDFNIGESFQEPSLGRFAEGTLVRAGSGFVRFGQGAKQLGMSVLEKAGMLDEGTTEQYTKLTEQERNDFEEAFDNEFGDSAFFDIVQFATQTSPFFLIPGAAGGGLAGQTAAGAAAGAGAGALEFTGEEESRRKNVLIGAAAGGAGGVILARLAALRNWFRKPLKEAIDSPKKSILITTDSAKREAFKIEQAALQSSRKMVREGLDTFDKVSRMTGREVPVKISNLTDDPGAIKLEGLALLSSRGQRIANEAAKDQARAGLALWNKILAKIDDGSPFSQRAQTAFNKVIGIEGEKGMLQARQAQWSTDFAAVKALTGDGGSIPIEAYRAKLATLIKEAKGVTGPGSQRYLDELLSLAADVRGVTSMSVDKFQKTLSRFGNAASGKGRILSDKIHPGEAQSTARALFGAFMDDLDNAAASSQGALGEALKSARANYKRASREIANVEASAVGRLFNIKGNQILTADDIEAKFLKMKASDISMSMEILGKADPALKVKLQALWIVDKLDQAQQKGIFSKVAFSPGRMFDLIRKDSVFNEVFSTPMERELVETAFDFTERIVAQRSVVSPSGMLPGLKEGGRLVGGATTGQLSPVFVGGFLIEQLIPRSLINQTLTRKGIEGVLKAPQFGVSIGEAAGIGAVAAELEDELEVSK